MGEDSLHRFALWNQVCWGSLVGSVSPCGVTKEAEEEELLHSQTRVRPAWFKSTAAVELFGQEGITAAMIAYINADCAV